MKLKTLKDLELGIGEHEEIRAEAVKWYRRIKKHLTTSKLPLPIQLLEEGQLPFIKTFFNLTEEDLK